MNLTNLTSLLRLFDVTLTLLIISAITPIIGAAFMFAGKALTWDTPFVFSKVAVWVFIGIFLGHSLFACAQIVAAIEIPEGLQSIWALTLILRYLLVIAGVAYWVASLEMVGRLPGWVLPMTRGFINRLSAPKRWLKKKANETFTRCSVVCNGGVLEPRRTTIPRQSVEALHAANNRAVHRSQRGTHHRRAGVVHMQHAHHRARKDPRQPNDRTA